MDSILARQVVEALKANQKRLTTVESCTGGMISAAITSIAGSSEVFETGFVTYSNQAKTQLVGVPEALLQNFGAVSEQVAAAMSAGALTASRADIAISVTGIAGPTGGSDLKPVGMVCFGISLLDESGKITTRTQTQQFGNIGRDSVRDSATSFALNWVKTNLDSTK